MPRRPVPAIDEDQPTLFALGESAAIVAAACKTINLGKRTKRRTNRTDEERAKRIVRLRLLGHSRRYIERECRVDGRTVEAIEEELRRAGKLPALKDELAAELGEVGRVAAAKMLEKLAADEVPASALPIYCGVSLDKRAQVLGEASITVDVRIQAAAGDPVSRLRSALAAALDLPSPALTAQVIDVQALTDEAPGAMHPEMHAAPDAAPVAPAAGGLAAAAAPAAARADPPGGGGARRRGGAAGHTRAGGGSLS